ncbi:hypothetical protein BDN70DRAFT_996024 [Pholiota conissans]|uniref:Uncharacterized protein n=1 Tax=Pholiota conissans TaxID=109636 RepID=A0A9P5YV32_9AGAR|nr:hypothetical protein BDN70DRAFT_996024 [Pholiota conissans]
MSESFLAAKSFAFRANLAQLVSPLRRVRPKVPFYELPAHRIPTLWTLYRGLLRNAPTEDIKFRVRVLFRLNKGSTGLDRTVKFLKLGHKWLDFFKQAKAGDDHFQAVLNRYSSLIATKREKAWMMKLAREEVEWQAKLRHRPILTGGYMRPNLNHGPLPRMKPQPPAISHLIIKRLKTRERRHEKRAQLEEDLQDLDFERRFEEGLQKLTRVHFPKVFSSPEARREWEQPILDSLDEIRGRQRHEYLRAAQTFSPELMETVIEARREKIRNKTREKERERRGELTKGAILRERKGPPAHILTKMTPKQREMDKISRSLSEVGYVAVVKKRLGFKLKNPEVVVELELGKEDNRPILDEAVSLIRAENRRRQKEMKSVIKKSPVKSLVQRDKL